MQMNPCPFCGASTRLGVVTKWIRTGDYAQKRGAYARCRVCNARGSLVTIPDATFDVRNERPSKAAHELLTEMAVVAWNKAGNAAVARGVAGLPLFPNGGGK